MSLSRPVGTWRTGFARAPRWWRRRTNWPSTASCMASAPPKPRACGGSRPRSTKVPISWKGSPPLGNGAIPSSRARSMTSTQSQLGSLAGIRVIDLSRYLSGPTTTMLLADLGADVIKVETLPLGDPARQAGPFREHESVYFMASNRNKRSIAVNLKDPAGRTLVADLAAGADVLVQNFRPGTVEKMGLG